MGGGYYDGDVARRARSTNRDVFTYAGYGAQADQAAAAPERQGPHAILDPYGHHRECLNDTPVVVALDVTRSRGDDSRVMYEKLPMFIGQIELKGYVEGAAISFAAIGDATVDRAPLQVGQFEADNRLDEVISSFWLEEGGGGTGQESYELAAFYYARQSKLACLDRGTKGYFFFVGDEGFYPEVNPTQVKRWLGIDIDSPVDAQTVFAELQEKYHVFFVYPQKSWDQRKKDIDAEIKTRVTAAGGQYDNVDIRASLIWNNRNDLDLHVIPPSKEEVYYAHKRSACGGWLDVDMNVRGETSKPVENVRWARGQAKAGRYKIFVQNYAFKERDHDATPFRVEVEVNGEIRHFDAVTAKDRSGGKSNVTVFEFDYDPAERTVDGKKMTKKEVYAQYDDSVIKQQWAAVLPPGHVFLLDDPKALIDVILGALAVVAGGASLDEYLQDMRVRRQSDERVAEVQRALSGLHTRADSGGVQLASDLPDPASGDAGKARGGRSKRL